MSEVNANIGIHFETSGALAQLRRLQAGLSKFHQSLAQGNLAAANAQKGLNASFLQSINATGKFVASQKTIASSTMAFTSALEKNQFSLRQYFRYSAAAATANTKIMSRAFATEREILNRARRDRVKTLQTQYIQMSKATSGLTQTMSIMPKSLQVVNGKFTELATRIQYAAQRQQFLNQLLKQGSTSLLNFGKNMQWAGRQLMVGLTMPLMLIAGVAAKAFRELEKETVNFRRVYGDMFTSDAESNAAVENIKRIGMEYTKFGVAIKDTMGMAAKAAAAGFSGAALEAQVKQANKLAVLGQVEQEQALLTTISLVNAFGLSAEELATKIDFLNAVENQTVLSIEDLTIAIPKAAPVVKQLGGSVEDLAFFLTAMKEGGIEAAQGANALKSGLAAMINPTKSSAKMLAELGINIKGIVENNAGDLKGTVVGFARALDMLDPLNRARAIEQMFGKFQFARLSTLFQNVTKDGSQASRALSLAGASIEELAILSERELGKVSDATGVKFQAAIEVFKKEIMPLGKAFLEALTPVVKLFSGILEKFNTLSDGTKKTIAIVVAVLGAVGPAVLMTTGLIANGAANLIKFFAMLRGGMAKLNGQTGVLGGGFNYLTQEELENLAQSNALHTSHRNLITVFNVEKQALVGLAAAYGTASSQARALALANPGLFAGGAAGAKGAVSGLPRMRKFADGILSVPGPKGAGDIQPAMLSPGEAIIPSRQSDKHRGLIKAIMSDSIPGFAVGRLPNIAKGARDPHILGMPKSFAQKEKSISEQKTLDAIDAAVRGSKYGSLPPGEFGKLVIGTTGRSFPVPKIGGVYERANGSKVFVKPMLDERSALAEMRATQIARDVHGLNAPVQKLNTMIDPTDKMGKRRLFVLESPFDPTFAKMSGKFTKSDYIKQLVASTLRGDKDLSMSNMSGKNLADTGTSGVFKMASGKRDFELNMPSMAEQARINLLGTKGGAKRFFAEATVGIAKGMTPEAYQAAMLKEINMALPKLRKTISGFDLTKDEKVVYKNMERRLEEGLKVNWKEIHAIHTGVTPQVKKELTANAIAQKFEEQKLRIRQSGHANQDFQVRGYQGGTSGVIPGGGSGYINTNASQAQIAESLKAYTPIISIGDRLVRSMLSGIEGEMRQRPRNDVLRAKWDAKKSLFVKNFREQITFDEKTGKFFTDKGGSGATQEQVRQSLRYQFGLGPKGKDGHFVARDGKKLGDWSKFKESATIGGITKGGGGIGSQNKIASQTLNQIRLEQDAQNKKLGRDEFTKLKAAMLAADPTLSKSKLAKALGQHAAHLQEARGESQTIRRSAEKYQRGQVINDFGVMNNYLNAKARPQKILDWNAKNGNLLNLSPTDISKIESANRFLQSGQHPTSVKQAEQIRSIAQLELKVHSLVESGNTTTGLKNLVNPRTKYIAAGVKELVDIRSGRDNSFYKDLKAMNRIVNLSDGSRTNVISRNESMLLGEKITPVTGQNTGAKSPRDTRIGGTTADSRIPKPGFKDSAILTPSQAAGIKLRGRADGTPGLTATQKGDMSSDLRKRGFSQRQIEVKVAEANKQSIRAAEAKLRAAKIETAAVTKATRTADIARRTQANELEKTRRLERQAEIAKQTAIKDSKVQAKQDRRMKINARQERVGRVSGGSAALMGGLAMGAMMTGQDSKITGGLFAASAIAGMAPMLANPYIAAGAAVIALTAGLWLLDKAAKAAAQKQSKLVESTSATTERMKLIGQMNNKVGASELYDKKRQTSVSDRYTTGFDRGKEQYGATFSASKVGKETIDALKQSLVEGSTTAAKSFAVQLSAYVSDGIMTAEQAHSVASQIGIDLNNTTISSSISGQLLNLIGPSGEDLLKNPLEVRVRLIQEQAGVTKGLAAHFKKGLEDEGFFESRNAAMAEIFKESDREKESAQLAARGVQDIELVQAQADSLNKQYDSQVSILEKQRAITTDKAKQAEIDENIKKIEDSRVLGNTELRSQTAKLLKDQLAIFKIAQARPSLEEAFINSLKEQMALKSKEKGKEAFVGGFSSRASDLKDKTLGVTIQTIVASGGLDVDQALSLMDMFAGDEKGLERILRLSIKTMDPGKLGQLVNQLGLKSGKKLFKLIVNLSVKDPAKADKLMSTIALIQKMEGKEVNIKAFFEQADVMAKLEALQEKLEIVEGLKGPVTRDVIKNLNIDGDINTEDMTSLLAVWDQWGNLPDETKKTVIQEYLTLLSTISDGDVDDEIARRVKKNGPQAEAFYSSSTGRKQIIADLATTRTMQAVKQDVASKKGGPIDLKTTGTKTTDPFLSLLTRLKNIRLASINAAGSIEALRKALLKTAGIGNQFRGLDQQLTKLGKNEQFIDWVQSMDPEEQKRFVRTATKGTGKNKGKVIDPFTGKPTTNKKLKSGDVVLSADAKSYEAGINKAIAGDVNAEHLRTITNLKQQEIARTKLAALVDKLGQPLLSIAEIEETISDEAYATAIATGKITEKELSTNAVLQKQATIRQKLRDLIIQTDDSTQKKKDLQRVPEVKDFLREQGLSTTEIFATVQDEATLSNLIAAMDLYKKGAEGAADALTRIVQGLKDAAAEPDLKLTQTSTPYDKVQRGFNAAQQMFDAKRTINENTVKSTLLGADGKTFAQIQRLSDSNSALMNAANAEMSIYKDQIQGIQTQIENIKDGIENTDVSKLELVVDGEKVAGKLKYVLEDLQSRIGVWERSIDMNYQRPIKDLQDASSALSNDLTLIDKEAQKINDAYDEQAKALSEVAKVNELIIQQQGEQLDLADALSSGDISAAAMAAQKMRETSSGAFASGSLEALTKSRDKQVDGLKSSSGLTKEKIQERQFSITQSIYKLENDPARLALEKNILAAKDATYAIELLRTGSLEEIRLKELAIDVIQTGKVDKLQAQIDKLATQDVIYQYHLTDLGNILDAMDKNEKVSGLTKDAWENMLVYAMLMDEELKGDLNAALADVAGISKDMDTSWENIADAYAKIISKDIVITVKYVDSGAPGGGATAQGSSTAGSKPVGDREVDKVIADKTIRDKAIAAAVAAKDNNTLNLYGAAIPAKAAIAEKARLEAVKIQEAQWAAQAAGWSGRYLAKGGPIFGKAVGTDTVPAMLTPGEFVMSKYAVDSHGMNTMNSINKGDSLGDSVYNNYSISVSVQSDSNPDEIARVVMRQIKQVNSQRIGGNRI